MPAVLNTDILDGIIQVHHEDAFKYAVRSVREEGIFIGISSGASLAAIAQKLPEIPTAAASDLLLRHRRALSVGGRAVRIRRTALGPPIKIDQAVYNANPAVGGAGEGLIMSDGDHRFAPLAGQVVQDLPDVGRGAAIRLPVGSSARMIGGSLAKARVIATRCRWPPDSWCGCL